MYVFLHVHMDVSMFVCMWRSEDSFPEPVFFLHLVVLGIKLRLSGKCLLEPSRRYRLFSSLCWACEASAPPSETPALASVSFNIVEPGH